MVRNYNIKCPRTETPHELIRKGIEDVINCSRPIRAVASELNMKPMTLCHYVKQAKTEGSVEGVSICHKGHLAVFDKVQEILAEMSVHIEIKRTINEFFNKLDIVLQRDKIPGHDIWNVDETGLSTVQKPRGIVSPKGLKQVGSLTSGERGAHVTMCCAVSATGNTVPPKSGSGAMYVRVGPMESVQTYRILKYFGKTRKC